MHGGRRKTSALTRVGTGWEPSAAHLRGPDGACWAALDRSGQRTRPPRGPAPAPRRAPLPSQDHPASPEDQGEPTSFRGCLSSSVSEQDGFEGGFRECVGGRERERVCVRWEGRADGQRGVGRR
eukprot:2232700-Rhodomonas_salina.4